MLAKLMLSTLLVATTYVQGDKKPWLGVVTAEVPKALAAHLDREPPGVMVINVVADSPADKAGIQQYDVVIKFDGQEIGDEPGHLGELIGECKVGEKIKLVVVRGLKENEIQVRLSERPDTENLEYVFETQPDTWLSDRTDIRGQILKKLPSGEWEIHQLGRLKDLGDLKIPSLPKVLVLPNVEIELGDKGKKAEITISQIEDDEKLTIETTEDGTIKVTREWEDEDGDQHQKITEYKDADELNAGDADAYELYESLHSDSAKGKRPFTYRWDWRHKQPQADEDVLLRIDRSQRDATRRALDAQRRAADAQRRALDSYRRAFRYLPNTEALHLEDWAGLKTSRAFDFRVKDDGKIIVRLGSDDGRITITFEDADDLKSHSRKLYRAFRDQQREKESDDED